MTEDKGCESQQTIANLLAFLRGLRRLGLSVTSDDEQLVLQSLEAVGWSSESQCRDAVAAVVVKAPSQSTLFATAWHQFWLWLRSPKDSWLAHQTLMGNVMRQKSLRHRSPQVIWMGRDYNFQSRSEENGDTEQFAVALQSGQTPEEVLREKDFAHVTETELEEMMQFVHHLLPTRQRTRRLKSTRRGKYLSLRKTLQKSRDTGEIIEVVHRQTVVKPRTVVLLCDVSGSMEQYSRVLLRVAHSLSARESRLEVFVFSTRLTRITRLLRLHDPNDALLAVSTQVQDWSGGTRLAENLETFCDLHAASVLHHRAIVLLVTDGFDSDPPEQLRRQLIRLSRRSQHVVWLNPPAGDPAYTPTAQGAKILNDTVDHVFPAHNFNALTIAWNQIRNLPAMRPVRRQRLS